MSAELQKAFPTCVGMNRSSTDGDMLDVGVPHMRGDEP